jgi:GAF domain-containing protein
MIVSDERDVDGVPEPLGGSLAAPVPGLRGVEGPWRPSLVAGPVFRALRALAAALCVDGAGLMLADDVGRLRAVGGSSAEGLGLEYVQQFERFGPAFECVDADGPIVVPDLRRRGGDAVSVRLARRAEPVRAVLSVPVRVAEVIAGALNFFRYEPHTWSTGQIIAGEQLADALAELLVRLSALPPIAEAG